MNVVTPFVLLLEKGIEAVMLDGEEGKEVNERKQKGAEGKICMGRYEVAHKEIAKETR